MLEIVTALAAVSVTGGSILAGFLITRRALDAKDALLALQPALSAAENRARAAEDARTASEAARSLAAAETTEARAMLAAERTRATRAEELLHESLVVRLADAGPGAARREWERLLARSLSVTGAGATPTGRDVDPDTAPLRPAPAPGPDRDAPR